MAYAVFDIETRIDKSLVKAVYAPHDGADENDVFERAAGRFHDVLDVLQRDRRLLGHVAKCQGLVVQVDGILAGQEQPIAELHRLREQAVRQPHLVAG